MNLFLVGIIVLLSTNYSYWSMFNGQIGTIFNQYSIKYIEILFVVIILVLIYGLISFFLGIHHNPLFYRPGINGIPVLILFCLDFLLIGILNINDRIGLDYIFFSLGPVKAEVLYFGLVIGFFIFFSMLIRQIPRILESKEEYTKNPKWIAINTILGSILMIPIIALLVFKYPYTDSFITNVREVYSRYLFESWLLLIQTAGLVISLSSYLFHPIDRKKSLIQNFIGIVLQICIIIIIVEDFHEYISLDAIFSYYLVPSTIAVILSQWKILQYLLNKIKLISAQKSKNKHQDFTRQTPNQSVSVSLIILLLVALPYWYIFIQPVSAPIPTIDLLSTTTLVNFNGVAVPFQNDIVYPSFEFQPNNSRQYLNLSGEWKFTKKGDSTPASISSRTPQILKELSDGEHQPDFDDAGWESVPIPRSNTQYEDEQHFWGVSWYRKMIDIPNSFENLSLLLKFFGVNYFCDVWIDGYYVGVHEGGFTSFAFNVTKLLSPGIHLIAVRVDNPRWDGIFADRIVPDGCDFYNYGGLEREIWIEAANPTNIQRADIQITNINTNNSIDGIAQFDLNLVIQQLAPNLQSASISVILKPLYFSDLNAQVSRDTWNYTDENNLIVLLQNESVSFSKVPSISSNFALKFQLNANVSFWSTKHPNLYLLNVILSNSSGIYDNFTSQIGFRTLKTNHTQLLLNEAPLKLAGVSIHEQYPAPIGRSLTDAMRLQDLSLVQSLHGNWWRGSYPFHPNMYLFSDRLGIACWEESPVFWANEIDFVNAQNRDYFESLWTEIVFRDYNRPSILIWGACNEPWAQGPLYDYLDLSKIWLEQYDPSRILSFACVSSHEWSPGFKNLEICTPNTYAGTFEGIQGDWYNELSTQLARFSNNPNNFGKPMISMEFGYWRSGDDTEQQRCFNECFQALSESKNVQGMTWWLLADYYGQDYYNSMGVFNHNRSWAAPIFNSMKEAYTNYTQQNL